MTINDERKTHVIDLYYNQGKTTRDIASIERMSIRDISAILKEEESKQHKYKHQQQQQELSSKAYELFSKGKTPVEVAIALNLRAPEVTILYREYWNLTRLDKLNSAYKELGDEGIGYFVKLCKLAKKEGMTVKKVINALAIANEDLPYLEERRELLNDEVNTLESKRQKSKSSSNILNERVTSSKELLKSYSITRNRKKQEIEHLNNEISRLESIYNRLKTDDEGCLIIKKTVEKEVRNILIDDKAILQFAVASVIEALRRIPFIYKNYLVYSMPSSISSSSTIPIQQSPALNIREYKTMIVKMANRFYDNLMEHFTNGFKVEDIFKMMMSLSSLPINLARQSNQRDIYKIEEPESYHDDEEEEYNDK
jgi:hypothetical protein